METFFEYIEDADNMCWYHKVQASWIDKWINNEFKNLMILAPPRSGKTEIVSKKLPLYLDNRYPQDNIIVATYNSSMAHELERAFNTSHWNKNDNIKFVGTNSGITGYGAKYILMDYLVYSRMHAYHPDYINNLWTWYHSTLLTRGLPGYKQLLITSRWNSDDIPGRILKNPEISKDWIVIKFPMIAEHDMEFRYKGEILLNDYTNKKLELIKSSIGNSGFQALYQQNPIEQINEY